MGRGFAAASAVRAGAVHIDGKVVEVMRVVYLVGFERGVVGDAADVRLVSPCPRLLPSAAGRASCISASLDV